MLKEKLLEIQKMNIKVGKNANNPHFKYMYATLDVILEKVMPILSEQGLIITNYVESGMLVTELSCVKDKETISSRIKLPENNDPQKIGSAITYYKRYNLGALLNIQTDADDDGNAASKETKKVVKKDHRPSIEALTVLVKTEEGRKRFNGEQAKQFIASMKNGTRSYKTTEEALLKINETFNIGDEHIRMIELFMRNFNNGTIKKNV